MELKECPICGKNSIKSYKTKVKFERTSLTIIFENIFILKCTICKESFIDLKQNIHVQQWLKKIGRFKPSSNSIITIKMET